MVRKKRQSKRITLKDKYKVQRRVVESHRKSRKKAKKDAKNGVIRHDKKKDPGIPNSWPFKNELLNDIARARELAEKAKLEHKQNKSPKNIEELLARANADRAKFDAKLPAQNMSDMDAGANGSTQVQSLGQQSRRAYLSTLRKVIDTSDILLQVLDARDPLGTRIHPSIEDTILSHYDKKMVLVLNKIDLIPKEAVSGWLNFLRKSRPTVAIKCGTNIRDKVGREVACEGALSSSCGVGVEGLLGLLKNYSRTSGGGGKTCVTVGIIGYPNVGKSSILNTLKRSRAVGVSPRPGFTTAMQEVVLDRNLRLVDSPGVVFDDTENVNGAECMLRNCVDADSVEDPIPAVQALLNRCTTESLMMTYSIPAFPKGDVMVFLAMIAKRNGKVLKGGIPDKVIAARGVLKDWNSGKIPFYTRPPTEEECQANNTATVVENDATIVTSFGAEFDVSKMDNAVMKSLDENDEMDFVQMAPDGESRNNESKSTQAAVNFLTSSNGGDDDDESMEMDEGDDGSGATKASASVNNKMATAEDFDFGSM
jgi:nuclear GTP-binding protein